MGTETAADSEATVRRRILRLIEFACLLLIVGVVCFADRVLLPLFLAAPSFLGGALYTVVVSIPGIAFVYCFVQILKMTERNRLWLGLAGAAFAALALLGAVLCAFMATLGAEALSLNPRGFWSGIGLVVTGLLSAAVGASLCKTELRKLRRAEQQGTGHA